MSVGTGDLITRIYGNFRGADFRGEEINLSRSPDCLNVWKDYKETESIRTRPGMALKQSLSSAVYGIFFYNGAMLVHSGTSLYLVKNGSCTALFSGLNASKSNAFVYEGVFYFMDGKYYLQYDGSTVKEVEGYAPTTSIARKPEGGGKIHEDVNMLSPYRINTFLADGYDYEMKLGNLFDSEFDEEGTISIETGVRVNDDERKRTSQYYQFDAGTLYIHTEDTISDVVFVFYDEYLQIKEYRSRNLMQGDSVTLSYDGYFKAYTLKELSGKVYVGYKPFSGSYDASEETEKIRNGSTEYYLDVTGIDKGYKPIVTVDDKAVSNFTVDYDKGKITFDKAPAAPKTDGQDNVSVKFKKTVTGYRENIENCTLLQVFDNRVFVSGNPDYPNTVWHCSLQDPTYFSDLDYYREGMDSAAVTGLVAGNNALWVFREPSDANTTVFYHTPTIDADYGKIYPSQHSSITTGCVGAAINFNDDIVFFSKRGMEGISGDVTTEQVVAHRSSFVDRKMLAESEYAKMCLAEWEGYLIAFIGNKAYLADSRAVLTYENHIEYEWFYWTMESPVTCATVHDGVLYLGTFSGVYTLTDMNANIESYWVTPKDKFKSPQKQKTTNKRGCVVEATGDISVYAKVEDTGFEHIGTYENVTDYFTCRIKRKKFKDIQLKFHSNTRFSLETATLECFIGGYIKR